MTQSIGMFTVDFRLPDGKESLNVNVPAGMARGSLASFVEISL